MKRLLLYFIAISCSLASALAGNAQPDQSQLMRELQEATSSAQKVQAQGLKIVIPAPARSLSPMEQQMREMQMQGWQKRQAQMRQTVQLVQGTVKYVPRETVHLTITIVDDSQPLTNGKTQDGFAPTKNTIDFFKVGTVTDGKYGGADLILVRNRIDWDGPDKPVGEFQIPDNPRWEYYRFLKQGNRMIYLPKDSGLAALQAERNANPGGEDPVGTIKHLFLGKNPFEQLGVQLEEDPNFTVPELETPGIANGDSPRQILHFTSEGDENFDPKNFVEVANLQKLGPVYAIRPKLLKKFEDQDELFVFRKDGTRLRFSYWVDLMGIPHVSSRRITVSLPGLPDGQYSWAYKTSCNIDGGPLHVVPDLDPSTIEKVATAQLSGKVDWGAEAQCVMEDMKDAMRTHRLVHPDDCRKKATLQPPGDPIYELKDKSAPQYHEFYSRYERTDKYGSLGKKQRGKISFQDFLAKRPILYWKDPFGRWVQLERQEFLPTEGCEPIIYAYAPTDRPQSLTIQVLPSGGIDRSSPDYHFAWEVDAGQDGRLRDLSTGKVYPYLFWEGSIGLIDKPQEGYVVKSGEVSKFLKRILPVLGLNERESRDFMKAWMPTFTGSPYFFITFLSQRWIDSVIPLKVSPAPKTVIRVLMDSWPLRNPIRVSPPHFDPPPVRKGLTIVEWGGLR